MPPLHTSVIPHSSLQAFIFNDPPPAVGFQEFIADHDLYRYWRVDLVTPRAHTSLKRKTKQTRRMDRGSPFGEKYVPRWISRSQYVSDAARATMANARRGGACYANIAAAVA